MTEPDSQPRSEALKRLDERLDALAVSTRREPSRLGMESGAGAGYRLIGELVGGIFAGLGLGWLLDRLAGTGPWGLICGTLIGAGAAIFVVARSAGRMTDTAQARPGLTADRDALDDDDNGPG